MQVELRFQIPQCVPGSERASSPSQLDQSLVFTASTASTFPNACKRDPPSRLSSRDAPQLAAWHVAPTRIDPRQLVYYLGRLPVARFLLTRWCGDSLALRDFKLKEVGCEAPAKGEATSSERVSLANTAPVTTLDCINSYRVMAS